MHEKLKIVQSTLFYALPYAKLKTRFRATTLFRSEIISVLVTAALNFTINSIQIFIIRHTRESIFSSSSYICGGATHAFAFQNTHLYKRIYAYLWTPKGKLKLNFVRFYI